MERYFGQDWSVRSNTFLSFSKRNTRLRKASRLRLYCYGALKTQQYRIHMDIGTFKRYLGIQAIINNPQGKRTYCSLTDRTQT